MICMDDWSQTKREVADLQRLFDRVTGREAEIRKRLRREFGVKTLAEAIKALRAAEAAEREAAVVWADAEKEFRPHLNKVKELLGEADE